MIIKRITLDSKQHTWQGSEQWFTVIVWYKGKLRMTKHFVISYDPLTKFGMWLEMYSRYFEILRHMRSLPLDEL